MTRLTRAVAVVIAALLFLVYAAALIWYPRQPVDLTVPLIVAELCLLILLALLSRRRLP